MPIPLARARPGERLGLLGNEAIVRGALEAGVSFVSGYPGTPASEIGDVFAKIHREAGIHFEWSTNEKVALETAFGAATMGARSLTYMKHLGLAYAGDPLGTIPYVGVTAGMVIVSAGDPGMVVSPNEQDQRHLGRMHMIPVVEPATVEDAMEMTMFSFRLSEETGLPVILRTTPTVAHARGVVTAGEIRRREEPPAFRRRPAELTPIPGNARRMRGELTERFAKAEAILAASALYARFGAGRDVVVASGPPAAVVRDFLGERGLLDRIAVRCVGGTVPIPRSVLEEILRHADRVLVVEELTPFIEDELARVAFDLGLSVEILGKRNGRLPDRGDYPPEVVVPALAEFAGVPTGIGAVAAPPEIPPRPPVLCPGCSHRSTYFAVRTVFGPDAYYANDIGCYTLGYGPPLETVDALLSMGSSVALASAASRVLGQKTLAFLGDSTFFHSGVPPLVNAVEAGDDVLVVVLDNRVTAMTGHQPSPATPHRGEDADRRHASPEELARAAGVSSVTVVDPADLKTTVGAFLQAKRSKGPAVIVARRDCAIVRFREEGAMPGRRRFVVDHERCRHCGHESESLHCGQGPVKEYERAMVLRRVLEQEPGAPPEPVGVEREPPCSVACPTNICVQGYIGRIAAGQYASALALIRRRNPLPVVASRVCHRPCEQVCTRRGTDGAIAINDLKRFLVDWERAGGGEPEMAEIAAPTGKRVAVVGAGPSGLACAYECRLRGHEVVIFDEHDAPGGLLVQAIPEHRLPRDVLEFETRFILGHGIEFRGGFRLGRDGGVAEFLADGFDAVYLGIGAMAGKPLPVPGADRPGAMDALDLLRRHHRGEAIAAAGKRFLVVGGGDAAVDAARTLVRLGADSVEIVYRRGREEMPAHPEEVDAAEEEGVVLRLRSSPVAALGTERIAGLRVVETRPGPPDESGRRRPEPVEGSETDIEADVVVAAIGQVPDLSFLDVAPTRTEDGSIQVDPESGATSLPGLFAGGDVTPGPKTVIHATAEGRRAGWGIDRHLAPEGVSVEPMEFVNPAGLSYFTPANLVQEPGHHTGLRPVAERRRDHADAVVPLTEEEAREEAARCLLCSMCSSCSACTDLFGCPAFREENGRIVIEEALCNGCGVCVSFCPNGAIHEEVV